MKPSGFKSVMAHRAPDLDKLDYFPTPPWAARAGAELIRALDPEASSVWEPAAGGGHLAHGFADYFATVRESDIFPHREGLEVVDFLDPEIEDASAFDWIATNPPFILAEEFIRLAIKRARRGVAMLVRLSFLEGVKRYGLLYGETPVALVAPFAERVPMTKGRWDPAASTATAYAWFIWRTDRVVGDPVLRPIPPGRAKALSRTSDLDRFCAADPGDLFANRAAEGGE